MPLTTLMRQLHGAGSAGVDWHEPVRAIPANRSNFNREPMRLWSVT